MTQSSLSNCLNAKRLWVVHKLFPARTNRNINKIALTWNKAASGHEQRTYPFWIREHKLSQSSFKLVLSPPRFSTEENWTILLLSNFWRLPWQQGQITPWVRERYTKALSLYIWRKRRCTFRHYLQYWHRDNSSQKRAETLWRVQSPTLYDEIVTFTLNLKAENWEKV